MTELFGALSSGLQGQGSKMIGEGYFENLGHSERSSFTTSSVDGVQCGETMQTEMQGTLPFSLNLNPSLMCAGQLYSSVQEAPATVLLMQSLMVKTKGRHEADEERRKEGGGRGQSPTQAAPCRCKRSRLFTLPLQPNVIINPLLLLVYS